MRDMSGVTKELQFAEKKSRRRAIQFSKLSNVAEIASIDFHTKNISAAVIEIIQFNRVVACNRVPHTHKPQGDLRNLRKNLHFFFPLLVLFSSSFSLIMIINNFFYDH